jgi:hypothetical protein
MDKIKLGTQTKKKQNKDAMDIKNGIGGWNVF